MNLKGVMELANEQRINDRFIGVYYNFVREKYPAHASQWPLVSGYGHSVDIGFIGTTSVLIFKNDSGSMRTSSGLGDISQRFGIDRITEQNKESVRSKITERYDLHRRGAVVFLDDAIDLSGELKMLLDKHAVAIGIFPMKIFLSHKGANKELVRQFDRLLRTIGYDTWLDEDSMTAGVNLHRGIADGFAQSCAAVFFLTKDFKDESYLENEIDLAMARHNEDGEKFKIITLVLDAEATVPTLLKRFLWKSPDNSLDAVREIIRALPIELGSVRPKP